MKKLTLSDDSQLFILSEYNQPKRTVLETPWGLAQEVYVNKVLKPSTQSEYGSESYRSSLSRAFNRAKQQIYFNPDMTKFVTLTYKDNMQDPETIVKDIKNLFRKQKRITPDRIQKFIYVIEKQQRGALHAHIIASDFLTVFKNSNGYDSVTLWEHGYSSVLDITQTDSNFKAYLYLFKYMKKSQRIGSSFVHSSRNLNNFTPLTDFEFDKKMHELQYTERSQLGYLDRHITRKYYKKRDSSKK